MRTRIVDGTQPEDANQPFEIRDRSGKLLISRGRDLRFRDRNGKFVKSPLLSGKQWLRKIDRAFRKAGFRRAS